MNYNKTINKKRFFVSILIFIYSSCLLNAMDNPKNKKAIDKVKNWKTQDISNKVEKYLKSNDDIEKLKKTIEQTKNDKKNPTRQYDSLQLGKPFDYLKECTKYDLYDLVEKLLKKGFNPNDFRGYISPLYVACTTGNVRIAERLLTNKPHPADPNLKLASDNTALTGLFYEAPYHTQATDQQKKDIVALTNLLLLHGADPKIPMNTVYGTETAIDIACQKEFYELAKVMSSSPFEQKK